VLETIRGIPHLLDFWIVLTGLAMPQSALVAVRIGSPAKRVAVLALPVALGLIVAATMSPTGLGLQVFGACGHGLTSTGALTTVQGLLNILLFVPAAVALTVATGRPAFVTGAGAGLSVAVEAVQSLAPGLGRSCQLHDVIANSLGAVAGVLLAVGFRVAGQWLIEARPVSLYRVPATASAGTAASIVASSSVDSSRPAAATFCSR
jgi:hypothetical protein